MGLKVIRLVEERAGGTVSELQREDGLHHELYFLLKNCYPEAGQQVVKRLMKKIFQWIIFNLEKIKGLWLLGLKNSFPLTHSRSFLPLPENLIETQNH